MALHVLTVCCLHVNELLGSSGSDGVGDGEWDTHGQCSVTIYKEREILIVCIYIEELTHES